MSLNLKEIIITFKNYCFRNGSKNIDNFATEFSVEDYKNIYIFIVTISKLVFDEPIYSSTTNSINFSSRKSLNTYDSLKKYDLDLTLNLKNILEKVIFILDSEKMELIDNGKNMYIDLINYICHNKLYFMNFNPFFNSRIIDSHTPVSYLFNEKLTVFLKIGPRALDISEVNKDIKFIKEYQKLLLDINTTNTTNTYDNIIFHLGAYNISTTTNFEFQERLSGKTLIYVIAPDLDSFSNSIKKDKLKIMYRKLNNTTVTNICDTTDCSTNMILFDNHVHVQYKEFNTLLPLSLSRNLCEKMYDYKHFTEIISLLTPKIYFVNDIIMAPHKPQINLKIYFYLASLLAKNNKKFIMIEKNAHDQYFELKYDTFLSFTGPVTSSGETNNLNIDVNSHDINNICTRLRNHRFLSGNTMSSSAKYYNKYLKYKNKYSLLKKTIKNVY